MASDPDLNRPDRPSLGPDDRYRIRRELGRGMMGVVWEADDTLLGRTVAIKTIELAFEVGAEGREQFERRFFTEARVAAKLSHPGIVVCHDVGKDPASEKLFIVFEHLRGRTLAERVAAGPIPWREAVSILVSVARAVHHAHEHGVVHRDLKPANVMLLAARAGNGDASAAVKIMDFGVARIESAEARLTADGDWFGSPAYLSPERTLGLPSDARSDIFSLGSILCTVLLGREWFAAASIPTTLQRVVHEDAPVLSAHVGGIPQALDPVVACAMAKRPEDRYASAAELADDLEDVLAGRSPAHAGGGSAPSEGALPPADAEAALSELVALVAPARADDGGDATEHPLAALVDQPAQPPPRPTSLRARWLLLALAGATAGLAVLLVAALHLLRHQPQAMPAALTAGRAAGDAAARTEPTPPPAAAPESPHAAPTTPLQPAATPPTAVRPRRQTAAPVPIPDSSKPALAESAGAAASATEPQVAAKAEAGGNASSNGQGEKARIRLEVEHPLENGRLIVWIDGVLKFEAKLHAESAKKIVALTFRSGRVDTMLETSPGRHEVRVEVGWSGERRVQSAIADVAPGSTGLLQVRLGRMSKDLHLEWSRLAGR